MNETEEQSCSYRATSLDETHRLAASLAPHCQPGDVVALQGDLGAGKTEFARGFIQALCGNIEVTSPTFTVVQPYRTRDGTALYHMDLYRLKSSAELEEIGFDEALEEGITLIEWPEIALEFLPYTTLYITLKAEDSVSRDIELYSESDQWERYIRALKKGS